MTAARRILLLVPHPDDEVVGCAVALRRRRAEGIELFAVYLTTGVPPPETAWFWQRRRHADRVARRRAEARVVAGRLAIEPLAFTDWPARTLRTHLREAHALVAHHLRATGVDQLWTPAYEGGHQDHDVTNFLASLFAAEIPVVEFSEYNAARGVQSNRFPVEDGRETVLSLSESEASWKAELAAVYRSERANLAHVRFVREVLRPLREHDYRRPAHAGPVFYQRFQWVPFRHPRVDFTPPTEVTSAIEAFVTRG